MKGSQPIRSRLTALDLSQAPRRPQNGVAALGQGAWIMRLGCLIEPTQLVMQKLEFGACDAPWR